MKLENEMKKFDAILSEMKKGKATKPNYYKLPESEVIELVERLAKDSKDVLSAEQLVSFSHMLPYLLRFPYKNGIEDLQKAKVFLDRLLSFEEDKQEIE